MKYTRYIALIVFALFIFCIDSYGQCPMCRIAAESNLQHGGTEGAGLNKGILYMLAMPYLLVATLGILWYKNRKIEDL